MLIDTFANRLRKALTIRDMKPSELAKKTKIDKALISHYLAGTYKAKQDKLSIIASALDVSPVWLMGYDVSINEESTAKNSDIEIIKNIINNSNEFKNEDKKSLINMVEYFNNIKENKFK